MKKLPITYDIKHTGYGKWEWYTFKGCRMILCGISTNKKDAVKKSRGVKMKTFNSTINKAKVRGLNVNFITKGLYSVDYLGVRYSVIKNLDGWYITKDLQDLLLKAGHELSRLQESSNNAGDIAVELFKYVKDLSENSYTHPQIANYKTKTDCIEHIAAER